MMWIMFARAPVPDAPYWPGRRLLAVLDALAWPAIALLTLANMPMRTGLVGGVGAALCFLIAAARVHTALCANHRYRFTTWRLFKLAMLLLVVGLALKFAL